MSPMLSFESAFPICMFHGTSYKVQKAFVLIQYKTACTQLFQESMEKTQNIRTLVG